MRRKSPQTAITWLQFTQLYMESWQAGHTTREFAERCGLRVSQVHNKVHYLQRKGVALPKLRNSRGGSSGTRLNVTELRDLVATYGVEAVTGNARRRASVA